MFLGLLHRMIFIELVRVFLLALVGLTAILLMGGIFAEATKGGLTPSQIIAVIPLLIPNTLPYTLPTTTLFATCVVYGRLAHDNEILAIKSAGINLLHVVGPAILLGVLASATTFVLYMDVIPSTHNLLRSNVVNDVEDFLYILLKRDGRFQFDNLGYEIRVKRVEGRTLIEAQFSHWNSGTKRWDGIVYAREAELHVNLAKHQLEIHMFQPYSASGYMLENQYSEVTDDYKVLSVDLPEFSNRSKRPSQMGWLELFDKMVELTRDQAQAKNKLDRFLASHPQGTEPSSTDPALPDLQNKYQHLHLELCNLIAEMHLRPSLALGCICFALIGCPVGIWFSKSDYLSAFITCFLPVVVIYYPLLLCGINMGKAGTMPSSVSVWAANIAMGSAALVLFRQLQKH